MIHFTTEKGIKDNGDVSPGGEVDSKELQRLSDAIAKQQETIDKQQEIIDTLLGGDSIEA